MDAADLGATVGDLMHAAADELRALLPGRDAVVEAIAISGMGETGIVVDGHGVPVAPGFAWFDPRGRQQMEAVPRRLLSQFAGRTGLPVGAQVSVAKLLHLRAGGLDLRGLRWFNLPEYVAASLGAREVSEISLASRTGLIDQETGAAWAEMLDHLGVSEDFLPPLVDAGGDLGAATASWLPPAFRDARVTVAGHDHLVSAVSGGDIPQDRYHVSMGTAAKVLLRVLDEPISFEARERLAGRLVNSVRHVVPGKHVVVAGVKTGLLMRRALQLSGISDRAGRDRLDDLALALPLEGRLSADALEVRGARNDEGDLSLTGVRTASARRSLSTPCFGTGTTRSGCSWTPWTRSSRGTLHTAHRRLVQHAERAARAVPASFPRSPSRTVPRTPATEQPCSQSGCSRSGRSRRRRSDGA